MGVELLIRFRQSPVCSQLEDACPFHSGRALDSRFVSSSSRRIPFPCHFLDSRVALNSPGLALKSDSSLVRRRGLAVSAHGPNFSSSFDGGLDWNSMAPLDRSLFHGERDQTTERFSADGSPENGFCSGGTGLSFSQRCALYTMKRSSGASGLPKNDLGPCQAGSFEEESLVRRDLSTSANILDGFCSVEKVCGDRSGSVSGQIPFPAMAAPVGVGIPFSLKMLKRRKGRGKLTSGLAEVGNSLQEAFSSMVFMMRTLQSHTLHMRQQLFFEEVEGLLNMVQREMNSSFVWLFQQIFSCTPELMMLVMILLANFTVYSVGSNPAFAPSPLSSLPTISLFINSSGFSETLEAVEPISNSTNSFRAYLEKAFLSPPPLNDGADIYTDSGLVGNGGGRNHTIAGGEDGDTYFGGGLQSSAMYSQEDIIPAEVSSIAPSVFYEEIGSYHSEFPSSSGGLSVSSTNEWDDSAQHQGGLQAPGHSDSVVLDQEIMHNIVAPVSARLEGDDYSCYDRTDLSYQQAISNDTMNPLLLANYAQFLFLVRHDHDRAEELFRRAVMADPCNSHAIGCFASFLWLARHNLVAAEEAYRAALSADPSSPYHAANYAHFLWHSGQ